MRCAPGRLSLTAFRYFHSETLSAVPLFLNARQHLRWVIALVLAQRREDKRRHGRCLEVGTQRGQVVVRRGAAAVAGQ